MRAYVVVVLCIVFLVANYYVVEFAFMGMTYKSDFTFVAGFMGFSLLVVTDVLIAVRVIKNCLSKTPTGEGEKK